MKKRRRKVIKIIIIVVVIIIIIMIIKIITLLNPPQNGESKVHQEMTTHVHYHALPLILNIRRQILLNKYLCYNVLK